MKTISLALVATAVVASGCATSEPPLPQGYTGPTARVTDTGQIQSPRMVHIFELTQVDGRKLRGSAVATISANHGRGFSQTPVVLSNEVPAKDLTVTIEAMTLYAAPILAMTHPTCSVKGEVKFKAVAGRQYRVTGSLAPEQCSVWIEETDSNQAVTEKVSGKGTK